MINLNIILEDSHYNPYFQGLHSFREVMVPILEKVLGWGISDIRSLFESDGLMLHEWEKARTDRVTVRESSVHSGQAVA